MRQFQFCSDDMSDFCAQISDIRNSIPCVPPESILIYFNWTNGHIPIVEDAASTLEKFFPGVNYYGCESYGNITDGALAYGISVTVFVFEEKTSTTELLWVEADTEISTLADLWSVCRSRKGLKAVELVPTQSDLGSLDIDKNVPNLDPDIKVFGGSNFSLDLATNEPCVIARGHSMSKNAMPVILYYGEELDFSCTYVLGWKGLGSYMKVTGSEGRRIDTINGMPAFSIYEKYLNLSFQDIDTLVFPLIVEEDGYEFIRTPFAIREDKSMVMLAKIPEGSNVRISFGDKNTILSSLYAKANEIAGFRPQVIKAFSCGGRKMFWGDGEVSKETLILQQIAPVCGFYTGGEIMQFNEKIRALNHTLVLVSIRENLASEDAKTIAAPKEDPDKSMVARLAYFVEKVSKEQDEAVETISGLANEYLSLFYINLKAGLFKVYSIDGIKQPGKHELVDKGTNLFDLLHRFAHLSVHPDDMQEFLDITYDAVKERLRHIKKFTIRFRKKYGDTYLWSEMDVVKCEEKDEPAKSIIIGFAERDKEIRREQEQSNELKKAYLIAENANQSKTRFLFNMSHDIRTPMNAITGFTQMARDSVAEKEKVSGYLEKIDLAGRQLLTLINQVLEMSRIESGKVELQEHLLELSSGAKSIFTVLSEQASAKGLQLSYSLNNIVHNAVLSDAAALTQIVMNLGGNAIKYTPAGGHIIISITENASDRDGCATFTLRVKDDGIGMSKEFQEHIFEPFSRENNSTVSKIQGTGLGMPIVKSLVDEMGGTITIDSAPDEGSTFEVSLSLKLAESEPLALTEDQVVDKTKFIGRRVLLVEDNELNREITRYILEDNGFVVEEADDGSVAVDMVRAAVQRGELRYYDIVLMDIQMPLMDGYQATAKLRNLMIPQGVHLPIVALSANAFEEDRLKSILAGMDDHIAKPINNDRLWAAIARFL